VTLFKIKLQTKFVQYFATFLNMLLMIWII